jgi:hypothetical protein
VYARHRFDFAPIVGILPVQKKVSALIALLGKAMEKIRHKVSIPCIHYKITLHTRN